ncbi:PREDICTED: uncharacterized protein CG43427 isoform X2 [Drosophila arizonae]|uniref:Uncharacterized protein CG43427 isoform X2 n=1 Tax=Drosophila arizonae TaxID=7263 RepID=A0ABM1Q0U1_DROAR|nr:PREDICTED: uncharacterized protein CG43427 isoform X2 [Drosophila arizonae]
MLIRHRPQLITYINNKHIHRAAETVKQTREIEAQRNKAESNINITMESESTEQNVVLRGNEDLMSTSNTSTNDGTCNPNGCTKKTCITSPDPTAYVTKARVTRPTPPPPSKNPMQFVQIKPCNLYQTAQEQLKKAEEVKKLKEVKKEEPEEWQNNLDNWKSSRRKRVEHIIDRVVETKKLELEEHDRTRRKSKTFTEMMEERAERSGSRGRVKLASLAVYNDDETNDLSDLGIGTSSASGKSSISEDYENNSAMSDNVELDKAIGTAAANNIKEQQNHINRNQVDVNVISQASTSSTSKLQAVSEATAVAAPTREYTPMSTTPPSTADPCEYTYEGAIQDYKQRVQRASSNGRISNNNVVSETGETIGYPTRRGSKIEDRLSGFEVTSPSDTQEGVEKQKVDVPRVDISKRKEIFEQRDPEPKVTKPNGGATKQKLILRDRLTNGNGAAVEPTAKQEIKRLSGDICSIRDRMQSLEQQRNEFNSSKSVDVAVPPLKQRLNSLQQHVVTKEEEQLQQKKPPLVALIDARQLEIMRGEEQRMRQQEQKEKQKLTTPPALIVEEAAHDDSGIQVDNNEELLKEQQQQQQLNEAIAALALEERQLEEAANAVNQIEAEFDELTDMQPIALPAANATATTTVTSSAPSSETSSTITAATQPEARDMEFSNDYDLNEEVSEQVNEHLVVSKSPEQCSQIFDFTKKETPPVLSLTLASTCPLKQRTATPPTESPPNNVSSVVLQSTQIPRPLGKPPMSPKAMRVKPTAATPQQFSINGRVEIFNSRQLDKPPTPPLRRAFRDDITSPKFDKIEQVQIHEREVVMCSPAVTIVSPEELPKPNTVKALSSCFGQAAAAPKLPTCTSPTSSSNVNFSATSNPSPKVLPRSRIPQITPPASPKPINKAAPTVDMVDKAFDPASDDYAPIVSQTQAVVHTPPTAKVRAKPPAKPVSLDPLAPNDSLEVHVTSPSAMPALRVCTPNESSLFKLANSTPTSPGLTGTVPDAVLCQQFMEQEATKQQLILSPEDRKRLDQHAVEESLCEKIDVSKMPKLPSTCCQVITEQQLQSCDDMIKEELNDSTVPKEEDVALCVGLLDCLAPAQEPSCESIDARQQPIPATGYQHISDEDVKRCDGFQRIKEPRNSNSSHSAKPSSPVSDAHAAYSMALMESCEQIIAEERLAVSRMMKSSLPAGNATSGHKTPTGSTPGTPTVSRKSKIPIPKSCCISASNTDSIGRTGYLPANAEQPLIAHTQIEETEINIKRITPPSSPKTAKDGHEMDKSKEKKYKTNIFDFLRRNFGHHDESTTPQPHPTLNETLEPKVILTSTRSGVDVVSADDFVKVDNSKFYLASDAPSDVVPPPLPKTAAPVNIEIRKTITTDEILEKHNTEQALNQEICDLLDDELNKLGTTAGAMVGASH